MIRSYNFGGYRLDPATRQLFRGASEVRVSPKAFDLLHSLIEHRSRALSKAELQERLWPATFVTEANLASLVAELRRALKDRADDPVFVRTVPRFGYAFCGQLEGDTAAQPAKASCWIVWQSRELPLHDGENVIGRDEDVAIQLDAPSVSRRHARIIVEPGRVTLEDLASKNGTFLNGARITGRVSVADLDELEIGSVRILYRAMRGGASTQTIAR